MYTIIKDKKENYIILSVLSQVFAGNGSLILHLSAPPSFFVSVFESAEIPRTLLPPLQITNKAPPFAQTRHPQG